MQIPLLLVYASLAASLPLDVSTFINQVSEKSQLVLQWPSSSSFSWPPFSSDKTKPNDRAKKEKDNESVAVGLASSDDYKQHSIVSLIPRFAYERWIESEAHYAFEGIIRNTGGYGPGLEDVLPGAVIASPSKHRPNYYYQVSCQLCR